MALGKFNYAGTTAGRKNQWVNFFLEYGKPSTIKALQNYLETGNDYEFRSKFDNVVFQEVAFKYIEEEGQLDDFRERLINKLGLRGMGGDTSKGFGFGTIKGKKIKIVRIDNIKNINGTTRKAGRDSKGRFVKRQ